MSRQSAATPTLNRNRFRLRSAIHLGILPVQDKHGRFRRLRNDSKKRTAFGAQQFTNNTARIVKFTILVFLTLRQKPDHAIV
jgi:hypothetical protein